MVSNRRRRLFAICAIVLVIVIVYSIVASNSNRSPTRYLETLKRLHAKETKLVAKQRMMREAEMRAKAGINDRLEKVKGRTKVQERKQLRLAREEEERVAARKKAEAEKKKTTKNKDAVVEKGSIGGGGVGGSGTAKGAKEKQQQLGEDDSKNPEDITDLLSGEDNINFAAEPIPKGNTPEPKESVDRLTSYDPAGDITTLLRLSQILIISKTYCPYSLAAKRILLDQLKIVPEPYVVELDEHPHGKELQAFLKERTGRGTVPQIYVRGYSIGGSDDVKALWEAGELIDKLRKLGGKRLSVEKA